MANVEYKRLDHAWQTVKAALDKIITHINPTATINANKFITSDGSGKLSGTTDWSSSTPARPSLNGSAGTSNSVCRGDHAHPDAIIPYGALSVLVTSSSTENFIENIWKKLEYPVKAISTPVGITYEGEGSNWAGIKVLSDGVYEVDFNGTYTTVATSVRVEASVIKNVISDENNRNLIIDIIIL